MIKWRKAFISIWRYLPDVGADHQAFAAAAAVHDNTLVRYARQERESDLCNIASPLESRNARNGMS